MLKIFSSKKSHNKKSGKGISNAIKNIFQKKAKIDEATAEKLEEILIMADFGFTAASALVSDLKKHKFTVEDFSYKKVTDFLAADITKILQPYEKNLAFDDKNNKLQILTFNGVNGSGKTTSIGKIAHQFKQHNKKILLAACDTFRAGAVSQLEIWAHKANSDIFSVAKENQDPSSVAYMAIDKALKEDYDIVMIDMAGRLQNNVNLMAQLSKTHKVIKKFADNIDITNFIVLDANIGQNNFSQLELFNKAIDISGIIVNKLDNCAKAGFLVPLVHKFSKPIYAIGVGESIDDLTKFEAASFTKNLFNE